MAKFTTTEGLTAFNIGGKVIKAEKDGTFDLTPAQENAILASGGHPLTLVVDAKPVKDTGNEPAPTAAAKTTKKGADAAAPVVPEVPPTDTPPAGDDKAPEA